MNHAIKEAIDIVGSQQKLAFLVGTKQSTVSKWLRGSEIKARYIEKIELATKGKVSVYEILKSLSY